MLIVLQSYISRRLLKTFALATVGLTLIVSLTGGVFNMMRAEALSPTQVLHLMAFVLPFALTYMLPISALFACAMVYGQLAADNEFDACRASGINIHRLLAPAFALSVFATLFSFFSVNYVLPQSIRNLDQLLQKDLQDLIVTALRVQGHIRKGPLAIHTAEPPRTEQLDDRTRVDMDMVTFMNIEGDRLLRVGTADHVSVDFWIDPKTTDPVTQATLHDVRTFDLQQARLYTSANQPLDPIAVPMAAFTEQKIPWLDLTQLLRARQDLTKLQPIQRQLTKLRNQTRQGLFYVWIVEQLTTGDRVLRLGDFKGRPKYEIRAERAFNAPVDYLPQIDRVTIQEAVEGGDNEWRADRCLIDVGRGLGAYVSVRVAGRVVLTTPAPRRKQIEKPDTDLDAVPLPDSIPQLTAPISDLELLGATPEQLRELGKGVIPSKPPPAKFYLGERVEGARLSTLYSLAEQSLRIIREIHFRLVFSAGPLVMLILAAALAIIFRGGQLLTAFVISFVPGLLVSVLNITGRQLCMQSKYHLLGLAVMWSGIALLAVADCIVLSRFLKR